MKIQTNQSPTANSAESYGIRVTDLRGRGFGSSSTAAVLASVEELLTNGTIQFCESSPSSGELKIARERVARAAFLEECRSAAATVAINDVYPVVAGRMNLVTASPARRSQSADGATPVRVTLRHLGIPPGWIEERFVVAVKPDGKRHRAEEVLAPLFSDVKLAWNSVRLLSRCALAARRGILRRDIGAIAAGINEGREVFDRWMSRARDQRHAFVGPVQEIIDSIPEEILAWKPMGAGDCHSLLLVLADLEARDRCLESLRQFGWAASPARMVEGLRIKREGIQEFSVRCGYRADLVGAADLGADPRIGRRGVTLGMAIEPVSTNRVVTRAAGFRP